MATPYQFRTLHLLAAMTYLSVACLLWRNRSAIEPLVWPVIGIGGSLAFIIAPFAAIGAMFDRMGTGVLCGLGVIAAFVLFHVAL